MTDTLVPLPQGRLPTPDELWRSMEPWIALASGSGWQPGFAVRATGVSASEPLFQLKNKSGQPTLHAVASDGTLRLHVADTGVDLGGPVTANSTLNVTGQITGGSLHIIGSASPAVAALIDAGDLTLAAGSIHLTAGDFYAGNQHGLIGLTTGAGLANLASIDSSNNINIGVATLDLKLYGLSTTLYNSASVAQLTIPNGGTAGVRIERLGIATGPDPAHELYVSGMGRFSNGVLVDGGGIGVTGNSAITGALSIVGAGGHLSVAGNFAIHGATLQPVQNITSSRGSGAALIDLLNIMQAYGFILNNSVP